MSLATRAKCLKAARVPGAPQLAHLLPPQARMVGRTTDAKTGYAIDIFAYGPVQKLRPWQQRKGGEWYERRDDTASDFTFPVDTLLPRQNVTESARAHGYYCARRNSGL